MLKKSRSTSVICIILAVTVLALGALIGMIWMLSPEMEEDNGYYTGGLNLGQMSPVIYELTCDETLGAVYLKSQSMGNFDGQKWDEAIPEYDKLISSRYSASYLTSFALENSGAKEYLLTIKPSTNKYVLPYYASTRSHSSHDTVQKSDIKNEGATTSAYSVYMHKYVSSDGVSHSQKQSDYESKYSKFVYENYLDVDSKTKKFLQNVIDENEFSATDSDIISKVTTYIRGIAKYDLLYDTALDKEENTVISFMSGEYESGVCRHFASSATLLYRALGIPARYTTGYLTSVKANLPAAVTAINAHAWVEVYINGIGWIQVEPTPPISLPDKPEIPDNPIDSLTLFKVQSESKATLLLKSKSYCDYIGNGWDENYDYLSLMDNRYSAQYLTSKAIEDNSYRHTAKTVEITPMADEYVLPYYVSTYGNDNHTIQTSDRIVSGETDDTYTVEYYNYPSSNVTLLTSEYISYESRYASFVKDNYLNLNGVDYYDYMYLDQIISEQNFDASDSGVIGKVCNYLKDNKKLTKDYDKSLDDTDNYAIEFLTNYNEGTSKHFAASATLIFRKLGLPARFTMGYKVNVPANRVAAVTADNTYYWVEVYKSGCGWIAIDIFDKYEDTQEEEVVDIFEIWADTNDDIYLKNESFGNYNGQGFDTMDVEYYENFNGYSAAYIPSFIAEFSGSASMRYVEIRPLESKYDVRYMLPYYTSAYGSEIQTSDVRVEGPINYHYAVNYYKFDRIPSIDSYYLQEYETRYSDFVKQHYLDIDSETYEYMRYFAQKNGIDPQSSTIIADVAQVIKLSAKYDLEYDASLDMQPNVAIAFLEAYNKGVCRHYAMAATLLYRSLGIPARYTTGYMAEAKAGEWVTVTNMDAHAWVEVYVDGFGWKMVEVTGSDDDVPVTTVELSFDNVNKQYDGSPLYPSYAYTGFEKYEAMGYRLELDLAGEQLMPGKSRLSIGYYRVYNQYGDDVTESFKFKLKDGGYMQVWIDTLYISSNGISLVYDGYERAGDIAGYAVNGFDYNTYILNNQYTYDTGEYHDLLITSTVTAKDVCKISNKFDVKIYANGEDITSYYKIIKTAGTFEIERKPIHIKAASIDVSYFDYMGDEFTFNEIEYDYFQLAEGDYIAEYNVTGSISEPGSVDNVIDAASIVIRNGIGEDVTSNYHITTENGKLNMDL